MPAEWNPASVPPEWAWVTDLVREVRELREEVRDLRQAPATYLQKATVDSYIGGATCTVVFESGATLDVRKPATYVPTPGDVVTIGISPFLEPAEILIRTAP